jgi:hypothetical protein
MHVEYVIVQTEVIDNDFDRLEEFLLRASRLCKRISKKHRVWASEASKVKVVAD